MNEIVNKFLLAADKFMPEMHLKQSGFTYSVCGPFAKKQIKNSKIQRKRRYKLYTLCKWRKKTLFSEGVSNDLQFLF